ncbi:MAG: hypothetical protein LPK11_15645 [Chromatiaceae bacterium]|nr:hypothetical protein [Chromatiaceae bacterium]
MLQVDAIIGQAELLLQQRISFKQHRYINPVQLRQHDARLADCLRLLADIALPEETPSWLAWLVATAPTAALTSELTPEQLPAVTDKAYARLLLHEIKHFDRPELLIAALKPLCLQRPNDLNDSEQTKQAELGGWLTLRLAPAELATDAASAAVLMQTSTGLIALGLSRKRQFLPQIIELASTLSLTEPRHGAACAAAWLLGQPTDEVTLLRQLLQSGCLVSDTLFCDVLLMLLMCAAPDKAQDLMVNILANLNTAEQPGFGTALAIQAMGFSGQLKFVPLLRDLSQQPELNALAANALALLLGSIDADALLERPTVADFACSKAARNLAGCAVTLAHLAMVLQRGNPQQRQLAACYQFWQNPDRALYFADVFSGGRTDAGTASA